jgi:thioredoxin-related protein
LFFTVVVYLLPGMWGAPLKALSGVLPPVYYSEAWSSSDQKGGDKIIHESCPNNLNCFHDYETALAEAKKQNKPLLLDFTGWTCVNCRYMEQNIWSSPEIDSLLRNQFVVASLFVDSRKDLPENQQFISPRNGKKITTYGEKWADLEISKFGEITQPLYVVLNHQEEIIAPKQSYTTSIKKYKVFLQQGLDEFNKSTNQKLAK